MGPGQDGCHGEGGNDRLYGGPDPDQLYGGPGSDYCDGGPGGAGPTTARRARGTEGGGASSGDPIVSLAAG